MPTPDERRAAIEDAFSEYENDDAGVATLKESDDEALSLASESDEPEGAAPAADETDPSGDSHSEPPESSTAAASGEQELPPEGDTPLAPAGAPQSWSAAEREHWAKLPPAVQQRVTKREQEITQALEDFKHDRQISREIQQMVQPHLGIFQSQGVQSPLDGIRSTLDAAAVMYQGTAQQKVEMVAGLIHQFGVDIQALDSALVGQGAQNTQNASVTLPPQVQQELDSMKQYISAQQHREMQQQAEAQQRINAETEQFLGKVEFGNDLRHSMADFMDVYARRGEKLTLQQAYDMALASRPDLQQVVQNRKQVEQSRSTAQQRRVAASSVADEGAAPGQNRPMTRREALAEAWESA